MAQNREFFKKLIGVTAFLGSICAVTTLLKKKNKIVNNDKCNSSNDDIGKIGTTEPVILDFSQKKKILITGAKSYIGESFEKYAKINYDDNFVVDTIDMIDGSWREYDFSSYDAVFHVAGIAHADVGKVSDEVKKKYYAVNTDLAIETAKKAKKAGVKQFVYMSSMIVYGDSAGFNERKVITRDTCPSPSNFYGDSKWQGDIGVRSLADDKFNVTVIRPPMIYGRGSKGNYPVLSKLAKKLPVFPDVKNERSMLHIDNLCEFLCKIMLAGIGGIFIPQNSEYTKTSDMVSKIAQVNGRKIKTLKILSPAVYLGSKIPGKIGGLVNKAFGNMTYSQDISQYEGLDYIVVDLQKSIERTELQPKCDSSKPKVLMLASVASMIDQFNMQNIQILIDQGYDVDVACNCKNGNTISNERIEKLKQILKAKNVDIIHIPVPREVTNVKAIISSIKQVRKLCSENNYKLVHCHSPIGSVIARIAAKPFRKLGTKVVYTAHGFHFYKGAPKQNWCIFYPIEKICSLFTDTIITINKEDYNFALKHFSKVNIEYIPGIGVDTKKFYIPYFDKKSKKRELGLPEDSFVVLSVGELNDNKNQEVIIKAIAKLNNLNIHYVIAGQGYNEKYLTKLSKDLNVNLHLLGYRTDVVELYNMADVFAFPSIREGLSVSLMEAMASGLPVLCSKIRGNTDLIQNGKGGYIYDYHNENGFADGLNKIIENNEQQMGFINIETIKDFDVSNVNLLMERIYSDLQKSI